MAARDVALPLRIGARTVWTLRRRLVRRACTLGDALAAVPPTLSPLGDADGYLITALPAALLGSVRAAHPALKPFVRQRYRRSYAALDGGFDQYFAGFSAKSRSTLKRKARKLADRSGGALDVRCYRTAEEMADFHDQARAVSATTYQERLLDAGLPADAEARADMLARAGQDQVRAWLLFVDGRAAAYLYAPAQGDTLIYAYLGYDPAFAAYSPGTVLQLEAMRHLFAEGRFRLFDFTEGEGQHKRLFATGGIDCVDLLLVRPTAANLTAGHMLNGFDAAVAVTKQVLAGLGADALLRRFRR